MARVKERNPIYATMPITSLNDFNSLYITPIVATQGKNNIWATRNATAPAGVKTVRRMSGKLPPLSTEKITPIVASAASLLSMDVKRAVSILHSSPMRFPIGVNNTPSWPR